METFKDVAKDMPYISVCDSEMKLYKQFEVNKGKSMMSMLSLKAFRKIKKGYKIRIKAWKI